MTKTSPKKTRNIYVKKITPINELNLLVQNLVVLFKCSRN